MTIHAIYTSPLERCRETAAPLAARRGLEPIVLPDLREVYLGEWEGGAFRKHVAEGDPIALELMAQERWDVIPGAEPAAEFRVKLEGAAKVGERYVGMVGIRDPYTIGNVDNVIAWARDKVRERFGDQGYELHYTIYGRNGVMGELEPMKHKPAHELCILVQGVAPTAEMAEELLREK